MFDCPDPRLAQGSPEWREAQGSYSRTPDLIAGPILGGGNPRDFLIDVWEPEGQSFLKEAGSNPDAARTVASALKTNGTFTMEDLAGNFDAFLNPLNKKLRSYSGERNGSVMCGFVTYFNLQRDGGDLGKVLAYHQSIYGIDRTFGLTHILGEEVTQGLIRSSMTQEPPIAMLHFPFPDACRMAFFLWCADVDRLPTAILLVNNGVTHRDFEWRDHPVIRWLTRLERAKTEGVNGFLYERYRAMPVR